MRKVVEFFIKYPVWVSVLMFSVIMFGIISLLQMRYSFFPEVKPDMIMVQIPYPGASPDEVAEGVVLKIEESLDGINGVDRITSISKENIGSLTIEIIKGYDINIVTTDVKNAIDRINSFPEDAEEPVIFSQRFRSRSLSIVVYGETDLYNLKYIAEQIRDRLLAMPEISLVDIVGLPELEFSIEVSEANMRRYGISFDEISQAVKKANINLSGGKIETEDEEILIRVWGRDYYARELLDIPLRTDDNGAIIPLGEIADIKEQWEDIPDKQYYNDKAALILNIDQAESEDILAIAKLTKEIIAQFNQENDKVKAIVFDDRTIPLRQRLELMVKNGIIGLLLILVALGFFLNLRLSFWVAISIPFAFAGMFIVANLWPITINAISLFGMIIVVGILVDDAIVVGENIFAHYESGKSPYRAAIDGTKQVLAPVTTSVMTTVIAFIPFFFLDGMMGKIFWQMALVVIASLIFSLVEAFVILPSHLAHSKGLRPKKEIAPIRKNIENYIKYLTHNIYAPILKVSLKQKWITVMVPVALFLFTIGIIGGGFIGLTFFPFIDSDTIPINISMVAGRQEKDTNEALRLIESKVWEVNEELKENRFKGEDVIIGINRNVGSSSFGGQGSHTGQLIVQLMDGEIRNMDSYLIGNKIRDKVGDISGVENIAYGATGHFGKAISISLLGSDYSQLDKARHLLIDELKNFETLKDVTDNDQKGRKELDIKLFPKAYALGLTLQDVARQVRQGFFGEEIQRIQRGRDEIRIWVRYNENDRKHLVSLDKMRIRTPDGGEYPFSELATYEIERGISAINHLDRMQEIKVEANQASMDDDLPPIMQDIEQNVIPRILGQVEGVTVSFEGQSRDKEKIQSSMKIAFPLALITMFILVVLVFRSYFQATLIFSMIPIGIIGAVWGHGIHGLQINVLSMFGIIALSGIIINDSIVLVDQINRYLKEGQKVFDAVYNASIARLRPILLTTITTALGLAPLILETSRQAQFLIPMAIAVAYGLIFGTMILLLILPASFLVINSIRVKVSRLTNSKYANPEEVEPAVRELEIPSFE
ncbi:MAG: AcrB/AcrD/AcrF family protein [Candidatus Zixiibacteriota bacterium]|nr:MAG: AcrB/AcrD/AcrF family protein [candidate division Zixibacteria bacterium]